LEETKYSPGNNSQESFLLLDEEGGTQLDRKTEKTYFGTRRGETIIVEYEEDKE